jgi:hypothetical protein
MTNRSYNNKNGGLILVLPVIGIDFPSGPLIVPSILAPPSLMSLSNLSLA